MARLECTDRRHFEVVAHNGVRGANVLGLSVLSLSEGEYVMVDSWTFEEQHEASERYGSGLGRL